MNFPEFMFSEKNKIPASQQNTPDIEGYYYTANDGSQMAFWIYKADRVSKEHTHDYDEYMLCVEGEYIVVIDGEEHILHAGDELFILMDGVVDIIKDTVYGDQFVVSTLDAGDHCVFGEMALIDSDKRSATVKAKTDCLTLSVSRKDFDRFCKEYPSSGLELLKLISLNLVRNLRKENENLRLVYQALIEEIETE